MTRDKNKITKILTWVPDIRIVAIFSAAILVLLLIPLFRIVPYAVPWNDDYNYGSFVQVALSQEHSFASALQGAYSCARIQWYAWQGTFSSIFFMALVPLVWGEEYYFLGPLFLILLLLISVMVLVRGLARDVLGADRASCLILQSVVAAVVIVLLHSSQTGLFWYNSGIHYVGMHSFLMLTTAAWIRLFTGRDKTLSVFLVLWTMVGAVLSGGANFVTTLQGLLVVLFFAVLGILLRNKRTLLLVPSLAVYCFAFYKNVSAPGNHVRGDILSGSGLGMDAFPAIGNSFVEAFRYIGEFTGLITLAVMIVLIPVIWQMVGKLTFQFRRPGLILLGTFCLYATGFTPSLYSLGHAGLGRTLNAVKITYQILLFLNEVYWLGWMRQKLEQKKHMLGLKQGAPALFYPAMGLLMLGIFAIEPNQAGTYSSYGAYYYVHTGEANEFHKEYLGRLETIANSGAEVVVRPYHFRPWLICAGDLSENKDAEENRAMASWYDKGSIICIEEEALQNDSK
ncbi:MAG: hypothetical protein J1E64_03730 [Acetatifactor sp.]|nr:hypothetical protein [Acetatifactor sp.]